MSTKASVILSLLYSTSIAFSSPTPHEPKAQAIPLKRAARPVYDAAWREAHRQHVGAKYSTTTSTTSTPSKRQVTATPAISLSVTGGAYYTQIQIGTPAQSYNVVLDTGSSDLWLASTSSSGGELGGGGQQSGGGDPFGDPFGSGSPFGGGGGGGQSSAQSYDPTGSSTFNQTGSQPFSIQYLGGSTAGSTARETVSMGGLTVQSQIFGVATQQGGSTLPSETAGLIGMAWQPIAQLGTPWWQNAATTNQWSQPLFAVALARDDNPTSTADVSGGSFTLGTTDASQFKGDIQYYNIPANEASWWLLPLESITVNGQTFALNGALSAIDTGTTLIGAPSDATDAIYQNIQGVQAGTGQNAGYYFYPCSQSPSVSFSFGGGQQWTIDPADFTLQTEDQNTCQGSLFAAETGSGQQTDGQGQQSISPSWIIGDTFLKNVYSVYRYNPPSVGFATLANSNNAGVTSSSSNVSIESVRPFTVTHTGTAKIPGFTGIPFDNAATPRMSSSLAVTLGGCLLSAVAMIL